MIARALDRMVYLRSHPFLFALLAATRRTPVVRYGDKVLVHDPDAYREILTRVPLDRTALGTTGGAAARLTDGGALFDQSGDAHRTARRDLVTTLSAAGVAQLRPVWQEVLDRHLTQIPDHLDLVPVAQELAGATVAAITGSPADPLTLAHAAQAAAAAAARDHLPGLRLIPLPGRRRRSRQQIRLLTELLPDPLDAVLAVAAVNTTVAALPRAAAWCARAGLWGRISPALAAELLRVLAPTPVLPRVAAEDTVVAGCPIHKGDQLLLVARHAAESYRKKPSAQSQQAAAQAVFGTGPHSCPGAQLARVQLTDFLTALAPHRPYVEDAKAASASESALPAYRSLRISARRPSADSAL